MPILENPPYLTFLVILIALLLSLMSTLSNRKLIDRKLLAEFQKEFSEWRAKMEQAKKTGDKKIIAKLKKDEIRIMRMRAKVSSQQLRIMLITFVPFMVIWWILIPYLYRPAAYMPLLGTTIPIPFYIWYIICSTFFYFIFSRIFR
ncbi:MAG: EMC3/TMCO1 family protein [Candidatus Bathyarchaeia archaeon]